MHSFILIVIKHEIKRLLYFLCAIIVYFYLPGLKSSEMERKFIVITGIELFVFWLVLSMIFRQNF
jgi:hypothetical protein